MATSTFGKAPCDSTAASLQMDGRPFGDATDELKSSWSWNSCRAKLCRFARTVALVRSDARVLDPGIEAREKLGFAQDAGWRGVIAAHEAAWAALAGSDVEIEGDAAAQGIAVRGLSPEQRRQSRRRAGFDRRPSADRRRLSRPRVLGHRDLSAAVLHPDLARSGPSAADVSLSYADARAGKSGSGWAGAARSMPGSRPIPERRPRRTR